MPVRRTVESSSSVPPARSRPRGSVNISVARSWLIVLVVLIAGPWAMVVWGFKHLPQGDAASKARADDVCPPGPSAVRQPQAESRGHEGVVATGPWGPLEVTPITLMPPPEFIQEASSERPARAWVFDGVSRPALDDLFHAAGLTESERSQLWAVCTASNPDTFTCAPDDAFVRGLSRDARARLYVRLGLDERNLEQDNAFRFAGSSVQAWLAEGGLRQELIAAIEPLAYRRGNYWMFADLRLVEPLTRSADEHARLVRTLAADQTLFVRLRVDERSNVDELTNYWGRGGREQQVRPILESLSKVPGGASLSIRALLPPFAQTRLSTYQPPSLDAAERQRDCHWTTMNFFNDTLDDAYLGNPQLLVERLKSDYYPVFGNFQLGDVVLFLAGDQLFHSAVFIADDILFTKNGPNPSNPWMFARLKDIEGFYPQAEPVHVAYYRHRQID